MSPACAVRTGEYRRPSTPRQPSRDRRRRGKRTAANFPARREAKLVTRQWPSVVLHPRRPLIPAGPERGVPRRFATWRGQCARGASHRAPQLLPISRGLPNNRDNPAKSSMTSEPRISKRGVKSCATFTSDACGADNEYKQANMIVNLEICVGAGSCCLLPMNGWCAKFATRARAQLDATGHRATRRRQHRLDIETRHAARTIVRACPHDFATVC